MERSAVREAKRPVNRIASQAVTRRDVLGAAASLAGGTALGSQAAISAAAASSDNLPPHIPDWQTKPGGEVMSPPYGVPSQFEASVVRRERSGGSPYPTKQAAVSLTPLQDLHGVITPNGLHYERHHAGVPTIDPQEHRLIIHGMVERPMIFTMDDIVRFPSVSRIHFLECSGNTQKLGQAGSRTDGPRHARAAQLLRVDGNMAQNDSRRNRGQARGQMDARGGRGRRHHDAEHSDRKGL
jgi:hypothetical protein